MTTSYMYTYRCNNIRYHVMSRVLWLTLLFVVLKLNAFHLRIEREPLTYFNCSKYNLRIWHTVDKSKVLYSHFSDTQLPTNEGRILTQPQTDAEKSIQEYFLKKEFPHVNYFLDDPKFKHHFGQDTEHEKWKRILRQVSSWMLEHKYLETDPRAFSNFAELPKDRFFQRVNYRHFPAPTLRDFHPVVQEQCEQGLLYCLKVVHEYAYAHMQQFNKYLNSDRNFFLKQYRQLWKGQKKTDEISLKALRLAKDDFCAVEGDLGWTWFSGQTYEPFLSRDDLFEFRTTASYYLCNYTLAQRLNYTKLAYPGSTEDDWAYYGTGKYKALECVYPDKTIPGLPVKVFRRNGLAYTMASMDGYQCNQVGHCKIRLRGAVGRKWKDDDTFWDFSCALLAFCPDPCCGAYKNPLDDPRDIDKCRKGHADFPCSDGAQNDDCTYDVQNNHNFFDLIQNRVNITCGCSREKGKKWDSFLGQCLDIDECEESNPCNAESEVCINRLNGSEPLCVCEFGFKRNVHSKKCEGDPDSGLYHNIISSEKRMDSYFEPIVEERKPNQTGQLDEIAVVKLALGKVISVFHLNTGLSLQLLQWEAISFYLMFSLFY